MRPENDDAEVGLSRRELIKRSTLSISMGVLMLPAPEAGTAASPVSEVEAVALPDGVHAVWDLAKATKEATTTRERVCLNGLWRWQPALGPVGTPPEKEWGWFKTPGSWPGITDYLQKDSQTLINHPSWKAEQKSENPAAITSAWYQREMHVPAGWAGRRVALSLKYLNTFATVFLDGKPAGEVRFPAGELDVSKLVKPGQSYLLSIYVQASPLKAVVLSYTDTNAAHEIRGSVERRGICGDVWLVSTPTGARIGDVQVRTSVEKGEITFDVQLDRDRVEHEGQVALKAMISEGGRAVFEGQQHTFTAADLKAGRATFTERWKPDRLWDLHTPQHQFTVTVSLTAEKRLADTSLPVSFGYREFTIKGKDFYLNGSRIFLHVLPLDNAQVGAAWASYAGAFETLSRFKGMGINFVYTHNYSCEPGTHLSFDEILRAADDAGILIAMAQPHFSNYEWKAPDADATNGYAVHSEFYVRAAQNHPSVVAYAMSHNATGYVEEMNPDMIDGVLEPREEWGRRNSLLALRAEAIVKRFDPGRIVYHHSSGNLGSMYTSNFYVNLTPPQELCDWFTHWQEHGVKPLLLCEYGVPCTWDWTMYRGWYKGNREWGSAEVPWEFCIAEWNAQFLGDTAYRITDREAANLRWEAERFKTGKGWHRWDYPTEVGSPAFAGRNQVFAQYITDNWRAYRTRGVSGFGPWEYEIYWTLNGNADRSRKLLPTDWDSLQRPGFSADYIDDRPSNPVLSYSRSDWLPTPAGLSLLRNNGPLLGYIAGKAANVMSKDHNFYAGETVDKQLVIVNNSRVTTTCECTWSMRLPTPMSGSAQIVLKTGEQHRQPIQFRLPDVLPAGTYPVKATFKFHNGEVQTDSFEIHVVKSVADDASLKSAKIALFDPDGETGRLLQSLGVKFTPVSTSDSLTAFDLLIIGKGAITRTGALPDLKRVVEGLRVVVMEQTAEGLEKRLGFRIAEYGMRQVFRRVVDHPVVRTLQDYHLRDWRGEATLSTSKLKYTIAERNSPQVKWCDIDVTRVWRSGCRGNVASVVIEKPASGDFVPIIDAGYALQYAALMEYREGKGMVVFCQLDVSGRSEPEPAAEQIVKHLIGYALHWTNPVRRPVYYAGVAEGLAHLKSAGLQPTNVSGKTIPGDALLIVGAGYEAVGYSSRNLNEWIAGGGHTLAIGLTGNELSMLVVDAVKIDHRDKEHIASHFDVPGLQTWLAGVCPADVHNRVPQVAALIAGGANVTGNGILARSDQHNVCFCQLAPWNFNARGPMNQKRTFRRFAALTARIASNLGADSRTVLTSHFAAVPDDHQQRWLAGLYLDTPEEWDDPYRFFGW